MEKLTTVLNSLNLLNDVSIDKESRIELVGATKQGYLEEIEIRKKLLAGQYSKVDLSLKNKAIELYENYIAKLKAEKGYAWAQYVNSSETILLGIKSDKFTEQQVQGFIRLKEIIGL